MRDVNIVESLTKTIGCVGQQTVKCGKKSCKCALDPSQRHGPYYYYRFWKLEKNGKYSQKKLYISQKQYEKLASAIEIYKNVVAGGHGNFRGNRQLLQRKFQSGEKIKQSALNELEVKIDTVMSLV